MKNKIYLLLTLLASTTAWALIQNEDVKSSAQLVSAGSDASHLINDDKIYVKANGLNKTLNAAIAAGDFAGAAANLTVLSKTANYTVLSSDHYIRANPTSGDFTLTLPTASSGGQVLYIKHTGTSGRVTIARNGSDLIDGETSQTLDTTSGGIILISSGGTVWDIF